MSTERRSPYICHVFVCTNDRRGERKSCADGNSQNTRTVLKQEVNQRGWRGNVRISQCGCMGLCTEGPNVILYPQRIWFAGVTQEDIPDIIAAIEKFVSAPSQ